ncbi:BatD family protein [Vibrio sp.]|nr:BatD family protein [Vibrio sp.]
MNMLTSLSIFRPIATLFLAILLLSMNSVAFANDLRVSVSKNKVTVNEIFQLKVTINQRLSSDDIQFQDLLSDFALIGRPNFGNSVTIVNGKRTDRSEWNVNVTATSAGIARIPSFRVAGETSQPIAIQVIQDSTRPNMDEFVEFQHSLNKNTLYPNESAILHSKLIIKANPRGLQDPKIAPPRVDSPQAITMEELGEPNQYQTILNGIEVTILEQKYRISSNISGEYTLYSPSFQSQLLYRARTGTQAITLDVPPKSFSVSVLNKPANYKGLWLPTKQLQFHETWFNSQGDAIPVSDNVSIKVGESLSRTITLDIEGLSSEQFPKLHFDYPDSLRLYKEKPVFTTINDSVTRMTIKHVLIPKNEGTFLIPSTKLNWWHSQEKKQNTAELDGITLTVEPGEFVASSQTLLPVTSSNVEVKEVIIKDAGIWPYIAGLLGLLWLTTLFWAFKLKSAHSHSNHTQHSLSRTTADRSHYEQLLLAIKNEDIVHVSLWMQRWFDELHLPANETSEMNALMQSIHQSHYASDGLANTSVQSQNLKKLTTLAKQLNKKQSNKKGENLASL